MSKSICTLFGHIGKPKRIYGKDKGTYHCRSCKAKWDRDMLDEDQKVDYGQALCPHCYKPMGFEKMWSKVVDCQMCKERIYF